MTGQPCVYEMFGADGARLYVGYTDNLGRRVREHAKSKPWFADVRRVDVNYHPTQAEALRAERQLIEKHLPTHNVNFTGRRGGRPTLEERVARTGGWLADCYGFCQRYLDRAPTDREIDEWIRAEDAAQDEATAVEGNPTRTRKSA